VAVQGGRCRGVLTDHDGQEVIRFSWGLGVTTNNYAGRCMPCFLETEYVKNLGI